MFSHLKDPVTRDEEHAGNTEQWKEHILSSEIWVQILAWQLTSCINLGKLPDFYVLVHSLVNTKLLKAQTIRTGPQSCTMHFVSIFILLHFTLFKFHPYHNPARQVVSFPFYGWENWASETFMNLIKVIERMGNRTGIPKTTLESIYPMKKCIKKSRHLVGAQSLLCCYSL